MTTLARYTPEDRVIDLSWLSPVDYDLITSLHGQIGRRDRVLLCVNAPAGDDAMYVRKVGDRFFAVHFPGGAHGRHLISPESPEHRCQKEYLARGTEKYCGLTVDLEDRTGRGRARHDVAIHGGIVPIGLEAQRRPQAPHVAKRRTTESYNEGWRRLWFNGESRDTPANGTVVPYFWCNLGWSTLPPRNSATAVGVGAIHAARCTPSEFDRCPETGRRQCGGWHPKRTARSGLVVDDVGPMAAMGELKPIALNRHVQLVSASDFARYHELTGRDEWIPGRRRRSANTQQPFERECEREHIAAPPPCHCGSEAQPDLFGHCLDCPDDCVRRLVAATATCPTCCRPLNDFDAVVGLHRHCHQLRYGHQDPWRGRR